MYRSRSLIRQIVGTTAIGLAALLVQAPTASAHGNTITLGANSAVLNSTHTSVTVCDGENDGRSVYAEVTFLWWGLPGRYPDSFGGGCTTHSVSGRSPSTWKLCEVGGACSPARPV